MKINGHELNVTSFGTGTPFVWGHGLMSNMALEDANPWWIRWHDLAQAARVVRYDARGHGLSEDGGVPEDYHWSRLAQDMLSISDQFSFHQFVAGGQSMGCATTIYAALDAPARMKGLVLVNPPTAWETRAAQAGLYDQMADIVEKQGVPALADLMARTPVAPAWQLEAYPAMTEAFAAAFRAVDPKALALVLRGARLCNLPDREKLNALTMPALILAWADDPGHPLSSAEEIASRLPKSRLLIAKNMDDVKTWTQEIKTFISGLN